MDILDEADYQNIRDSLDLPALNMSEEEAEAILREHGTSGKEVVNGFIEQLLKERSEAIAALSARDREIREVLEGLCFRHGCWCELPPNVTSPDHTCECGAARALWKRVQINLKEDDNAG